MRVKMENMWKTCDGTDKDFQYMCRLLDEDLDRRVGKAVQREKYAQYNTVEKISEALVYYIEDKPVACGAIRKYDDLSVELKRVFVMPEYQGKGIGTELVLKLENWAKELGYLNMILETGMILKEACALYQKLGYEAIPNYGPYVNMPESLCMAKKLG